MISVLPNLIGRFNVIRIKYTVQISTKGFSVCVARQETRNRWHNTEGEEQNWRTDAAQLQGLSLNNSSCDHVALMRHQTDRSVEQNGDPRNKPSHSPLAFDQRQHTEAKSIFSTSDPGTATPTCMKNKRNTHLLLFTKVNSKQIIDSSVKSQ